MITKVKHKFSFIVIGKNESWKITECLNSIYKAIEVNNLVNCEIVYVDSQSTDDSLERVLKFQGIKAFQITGKCNAAIARNIGAKESTGDTFIFLDGDMELFPKFIEEVLRLFEKNIQYISGQIEEYLYDEKWNFLDKRFIFSQNKLNKYDLTNGGGFVINKSLWELAQGMRTKFDRSQDIDFIYRLIRKKHLIFRSKETFVKHHTIQYNYNTNIKKELSVFRNYLFRGLLLRENLFNFRIIKRTIRIHYTLISLLISTLLLVFFDYYYFLIYIAIISFRSFSQYRRFKKASNVNFFTFLFKTIYLDITGVLGALFFFPKKKSISYKAIK